MTEQDAYNAGLTASENSVIENFTKLMTTGSSLKFQNPKMEELRLKLSERFKELEMYTSTATYVPSIPSLEENVLGVATPGKRRASKDVKSPIDNIEN